MKKIKLLLIMMSLLVLSQAGFSAFTSMQPTAKKDTTSNSFQRQNQRILLQEFISLTPKQYEQLTGKKLNFIGKIKFKLAQQKAKKKLENDSEGFNFGGFILGLLLGLIGVLLAYIFSKDRNFRKWTWYGWLAWLALLLILII